MRSDPPIDSVALLENAGGDAALALDLLRIFRDSLAVDAGRLADMPDQVVRAALAHKVMGAALVIGARGLAAAAGDARRGEVDETYRLALARTRAAIDVMLSAGRLAGGGEPRDAERE